MVEKSFGIWCCQKTLISCMQASIHILKFLDLDWSRRVVVIAPFAAYDKLVD